MHYEEIWGPKFLYLFIFQTKQKHLVMLSHMESIPQSSLTTHLLEKDGNKSGGTIQMKSTVMGCIVFKWSELIFILNQA